MALLLCKRGGVQLAAAYFSKSSSSSSTSTLRCISRSLAESKRGVNNGGRWAAVGGAVRGYSEDASSKMQREVEMLRNELKESSERMQFQSEKLRDEIEEKIKESPSEEELRSEIGRAILYIVKENTANTTGYIRLLEELRSACLKRPDQLDYQESPWIYKLAKATIPSALYIGAMVLYIWFFLAEIIPNIK